ncbi:MAG: response regulator [Desulfobulbaceae bacterium]|nr:response regulator [Desulfobulbaceae bacterium]
MFIDDDADLAYLGKKSLEKIGCSITVFTSSQKALQTFQTNPAHFDLVITDQTMPELTGFELSKKLLAIRSDLPIILCTGHSDIVDAKKAKSIGIKDFLMKPLDIHTLTGSIQKMLGS